MDVTILARENIGGRRVAAAAGAGASIVNYGAAIARMREILKRSLEPFPEALKCLP